jgi:PDZ domain-containing protein
LTEPGAPQPDVPRRRPTWLAPGRIATTGSLLLVLAIVIAWIVPANGYDLLLVDPAHPVDPLVRVEGHHARPGRGAIYFVDVQENRARFLERIVPWVRPDGSSLVPAPDVPTVVDRRLAQAEMLDSQRIAPYAALRLLGYKVSARFQGITVLAVERDAPAAKVLQPDDVLLGADGRTIRTILELRATLAAKTPGDRVTISFRRHGRTRTATFPTVADPLDPRRAIVGISAEDNLRVKLPFAVRINAGAIGGPSAGLAFALEILRDLGRDVTHGRKVAATGELQLDGTVRPIGGVKQKTLGARRAHVDVFLVPAGSNAREARRYADGLRIVPVENLQQALRALATLAPKA